MDHMTDNNVPNYVMKGTWSLNGLVSNICCSHCDHILGVIHDGIHNNEVEAQQAESRYGPEKKPSIRRASE